MSTKLFKRIFKGRSLPDVQEGIGRRGGVVVRTDQQGDQTTAYYEADERAVSARESTDDECEVSLDEVTKI